MNSNEFNFNSGNGLQTKTQDLRQIIRETHQGNTNIAKRNDFEGDNVEL